MSRVAALAARLQQLSGAAFERALEAALHQTWDDGWCEHEKPEPGHNPYNILTRVPESFLKPAMELATARAEFLEKNLDQHLFPGLFKETNQVRGSEQLAPVDAVLFPTREISLDDVVGVVEKMRDAPVPTMDDLSYDEHELPGQCCGICSKTYDDCDCAQTVRR